MPPRWRERADPRARHLLDVLRRREGDPFDAGLINGPRGKGRLEKIAPGAPDASPSPGANRPRRSTRSCFLNGPPRPQTARKILQEATALGVGALHFFTAEKTEAGYARAAPLWAGGEWRRHPLGVAGARSRPFCTRLPRVTHGLALAAVALDHTPRPPPRGSPSTITKPRRPWGQGPAAGRRVRCARARASSAGGRRPERDFSVRKKAFPRFAPRGAARAAADRGPPSWRAVTSDQGATSRLCSCWPPQHTLFGAGSRRSCRVPQRPCPGSSNAAPGPKRCCCPPGCTRKRFRGVSLEGDSLSEDCGLACPRGARRGHPFGTRPSALPSSRFRAPSPFRAALRIALSDRNGGSAEFFTSLLGLF